jgi:hypothetical protein
MVKYFFDLDDGSGSLRDEAGIELPNFDIAIQEATHTATDVARDAFRNGASLVELVIRDDSAHLLTITILMTKSQP